MMSETESGLEPEASDEESAQAPLDDSEPSAETYRQAIKANPKDSEAYYELGLLLKEQGNNGGAIEHLSKAAGIRKGASEIEQAVEAYKHLVQIEPVDPAHRLLLAECHEELEQVEAAVEQYQEAAVHFMQQEDYVPSLETIRLVLKHDPENLRDHVRIAESFAALDMKKEASETLDIVVQLLKKSDSPKSLAPVTARLLGMQGDRTDLCNDLASHFLETREPNLAIPCLQKAYEQEPDDTQTLGLLAEAFSQLGQTHKTVAVLKKKAAIYEKQGLEEERNQTLRDILIMNPEETKIKEILSPPSDIDAEPEELEISELPEEEIDALIAQIQDAEDEQELGFGTFSIDEEGEPVLPPELGRTQTTSGASSSRVGTDELKRVREQSVITSMESTYPTGSTEGASEGPLTRSEEIMALVERFEAQIGSEDEAGEPRDEIGFDTEPASGTEMLTEEPSEGGAVAIDLSAELEEFDFYVESDLVEEARELLADLSTRYPENEELITRKEKLENG